VKYKHLLLRAGLIFATALIGYIVVSSGSSTAAWPRAVGRHLYAEAGVPVLTVNQLKLGIRDARIVFADARTASNPAQTLEFIQARAVPFDVPSAMRFSGPAVSPGYARVGFVRHEIQLLPRVLTIDKKEHPWRSAETMNFACTRGSPTHAQRKTRVASVLHANKRC